MWYTELTRQNPWRRNNVVSWAFCCVCVCSCSRADGLFFSFCCMNCCRERERERKYFCDETLDTKKNSSDNNSPTVSHHTYHTIVGYLFLPSANRVCLHKYLDVCLKIVLLVNRKRDIQRKRENDRFRENSDANAGCWKWSFACGWWWSEILGCNENKTHLYAAPSVSIYLISRRDMNEWVSDFGSKNTDLIREASWDCGWIFVWSSQISFFRLLEKLLSALHSAPRQAIDMLSPLSGVYYFVKKIIIVLIWLWSD